MPFFKAILSTIISTQTLDSKVQSKAASLEQLLYQLEFGPDLLSVLSNSQQKSVSSKKETVWLKSNLL